MTQDFTLGFRMLEWRRGLQTLEELGAYRTDSSTLIVGSATPMAIRSAGMTPAAFRTLAAQLSDMRRVASIGLARLRTA